MPYQIPACAGKPYQPSNGTEGLMFQERFCDRCIHETLARRTGDVETYGCRIYLHVLLYDKDDPKYPSEWTHDFKGRPVCTAFEDEDPRRGPRAPREPSPSAHVQLTLDYNPVPALTG